LAPQGGADTFGSSKNQIRITMRMKLLPASLFIALALWLPATVSAQEIINADFENWDDFGFFSDPSGWATTNVFSQFGIPVSAEATAESYSGDFAIQLETREFQGQPSQGLAITGYMDNPIPGIYNVVPGYEFEGRPEFFGGYYQYFPASPADSFLISFSLQFNDTINDTVINLARAFINGNDTVDGYTNFQIPVDYTSDLEPNQATVFLISSDTGNPVVGSRLLVDSLYLVFNDSAVSVAEAPSKTEPTWQVFPNPVSDQFRLKTASVPLGVNQVRVMDLQGRLVLQEVVLNEQPISVRQLPPGFYLVSLLNDEGAMLGHRKIQVIR